MTSNAILKEDIEFILKEASESLMYLKGKSIFITGGTGSFGKWMLETFRAANEKEFGINVTVLSRNPQRFIDQFPHLSRVKGFNFIQGDVRSFDFPKGKFDIVIHAATDASATMNKERPLEMFEVIVDGTKRVLEFSKKCECKKVLLTSSGAVYGKLLNTDKAPSEAYRGAPDTSNCGSAYGEGKRVSELLGTLFSNETGIDFLVARCFSFVGPFLPMDGTYAIGNFILNAIEGRDIVIKGDGSPVRSFLYGAELVVFLLKILKDGKSCYPYNVGSDEAIDLKELAGKVKLHSKNIDVIVENKSTIGIAGNKYYPNINRLKNELGLVQKICLSESIARTILWGRESKD